MKSILATYRQYWIYPAIATIIFLLLWAFVWIFFEIGAYIKNSTARIHSSSSVIESAILNQDVVAIRNLLGNLVKRESFFIEYQPPPEFSQLAVSVGDQNASKILFGKVHSVSITQKGAALGTIVIHVNYITLAAQTINRGIPIGIFIVCLCILVTLLANAGVIQTLNQLSNSFKEINSSNVDFDSVQNRELSFQKLFGNLESKNDPITNSFMELLRNYSKILNEHDRQNNEIAISKHISQLAAQVAHDIRSPLSALNLLEQDLGNVSPERRQLAKSAIQRINDIANELLASRVKPLKFENQKSKVEQTKIASTVEKTAAPVLVPGLLEMVLSEKRIQYRGCGNLSLNLTVHESAIATFSNINKVELSRIISNLINNSIEAVAESGSVHILVTAQEKYISISIQDSGKGFPPEVLANFGQVGLTVGKINGNGLGVSHAVKYIESVGGTIAARNSSHGAVVEIKLLACEPPDWMATRVAVPANAQVVIVDDDPSIHDLWNARFLSLPNGLSSKPLVHLFSPDELVGFVDVNRKSNCLFLVDYEFSGEKINGFELINDLKIEKASMLVTSQDTNLSLQKKCMYIGLKILPKLLVSNIKIEIL
jgi:signal transduction histidine kinase